MVRKCFCDGNDGDNDNGGGDDVNICLYKILKRIMIYIEVTKVQECFKKAFCYKLLCRKLLLVALGWVRISDCIDCHLYNYVSKDWSHT